MTSSSCVAASLLRPSPQSLWSPSAVFLRIPGCTGRALTSPSSHYLPLTSPLFPFIANVFVRVSLLEGLVEEIAFEFQLVRCTFFLARCEVCDMGELQSPATRVWS